MLAIAMARRLDRMGWNFFSEPMGTLGVNYPFFWKIRIFHLENSKKKTVNAWHFS